MTGASLKRARLKLGISQAEMAREIGINKSSLSRIEKSDRDNSLKRWERILNAYGFAIIKLDEPKTTPDNWNDYTEQA